MHAVGAGRAKQFDAYWESAREEIVATTEVAIRAYLSALKEDPDVVERVARAIDVVASASYFGSCGKEITSINNAHETARAALSAIEVE